MELRIVKLENIKSKTIFYNLAYLLVNYYIIC